MSIKVYARTLLAHKFFKYNIKFIYTLYLNNNYMMLEQLKEI